MSRTNGYLKALGAVREHLAVFGDTVWLPQIDGWILDLNSVKTVGDLRAHLERARNSTHGMGSLGDFSITPQAGHLIANDREKIGAVSRRLWEITGVLYREAEALLGELRDRNNAEAVDV